MKHIEVVAAIIGKGDKIFATQRGYGEWKDWWEFPGGKMARRWSAVRILVGIIACLQGLVVPVGAQSTLHRIDSILTLNYRKGDIDTAYIARPATKWTITAKMNVSGAKIEAEGMDNGQHFKAEMEANRKTTLSVGVSYLGLSLSASLNPAKMMGKYRDFELNFNSYGRRFGFDIIYQDAKNFTGWYDSEGMERLYLPADMLKVKTLNVNAFYVFNSRRFSYPAAFSQTYIQRRSAGSFLLAFSGQGQLGKLKMEKNLDFKMMNIGLGAGYGYNFVPGKGWLLHISALPALIIFSKTSMSFGEERVPMTYDFPEIIITGRGSVVRQWSNKFLGLSVVFTYTDIGKAENLTVNNNKWRIRTFFGWRL